MDNISIPPNFMDVYLPFVQCLIESQQTELIDIYELATHYFEDKVEGTKVQVVDKTVMEDLNGHKLAYHYPVHSDVVRTRHLLAQEYTHGRTASQVERNRNRRQRDISPKHGTEPMKSDFTYDSILEQFPTNLYPEQSHNTNVGPVSHEKFTTKTLAKKRRSSEPLKADSATQDKLLELMLEFSQLLPEYIKVMADFIGTFYEKGKSTHASGEIQEIGLEGVLKKPEIHVQNERTEKEDSMTKYPKAKESKVKIQIPKCDSTTQTQAKFTGCSSCEKCRTLSELNTLSTTDQGTSSYVRNVEKAAKYLMQSINNGTEQRFRIEPSRHEIERKETEMDEVRRILENCMDSLNAQLQREHYERFPEQEPQIIVGKSFFELVGNNFSNTKEVQTVSDFEAPRKSSSSEEFFIPKKAIKDERFKREYRKEMSEIPITAGSATNFLEPGTELSLDALDHPESQRFLSDTSLSSVRSEDEKKDRKQFHSFSSLTESLSTSSSESSSLSDSSFLIKDRLLENASVPIGNNSAFEDENSLSSQEPPLLGPRETVVDLTSATMQVDEKFVNFTTNNCDEEHLDSHCQKHFQMQSKVQKNNPHFQSPANKGGICICGNNKPLTTLDSVALPMDGKSWLRTYFTVQMIHRFQKNVNLDVPFVEDTDLGTSMFKQSDTECTDNSNFQFQRIFSAVRTWYFNRTFREYQK